MAPSTSPDRQTYRDLVAQVAAKAKAILPHQVNGRLEKAVSLVLHGDVLPHENGSISVGSFSDPRKSYRLQGHSCECQDFQHKAPEGWCCHRIAAGVDQRVRELLAAQPAPAPNYEIKQNGRETPLPEAPASANVHVTIAGRDVLLTLRDHDEARLLVRLEEVLQRFPQPSPPAPSGQGICPHHGAMKPSTKGKGFYCPHKRQDGSWCPGR